MNLRKAPCAPQQCKTAHLTKSNLHEMSAHEFLMANLHQAQSNKQDLHTTLSLSDGSDLFHDAVDGADIVPDDGEDPHLLVNAAKTGKSISPSDIRQILSQASSSKKKGNLQSNITYTVTASRTQHTQSLVD